MNNVENRIVEMKFDNAQFEQAVAKTMETLDKFKEKLNFEKSGKGLDKLGKATNEYEYSLTDVGRAVDGIADQLEHMDSIGNMAFMRLKNAALDFAQNGFKKVIGDVMEGGMSRAMNLEQAKFQLEGILGSAEEVNRVIYSDILPELQGTPFSLDQAAVVMGQLAASGKTTSEEVQQGTRAIAGAAAMTNSSFADMGRIFTKVAGNGRVMGDTLQEMSSRGLNAAADMGKVFDMTEAEVREAVTAGEISYDMFAEAMDQLYGEQAKKSTTMYTGALEDLRAALARIGAEPMAVKLEFLRDAFNALVPVVDVVNGVFKRFTSASKELETVTDEAGNEITRYAKPFSGDLARRVQATGWEFQKLFVQLDDNNDILRYNKDNWKDLGLELKKNEDGTVSYIEHVKDAFGNDVEVAHDFGEAVMNPDMYRIATAAAESFVNVIAALGNLLGAVGKGILEAFPKLALSNIADVVEGVQRFTKALVFSEPVLNSIQAIVRAIFTPLGLLARVLIIIGKVMVEAFTMAYRAIKPFVKIVLSSVGLAANIFSGLGSVIDQVAMNITWFAEKVYNGMKAIAQFLKLDVIFTKIREAMDKLSTSMQGGGAKIYDFLSNFSSKMHEFGKKVYELLRLDKVAEAIGKFKERFAELMETTGHFGFDKLANSFKTMMGVVRTYADAFKPLEKIKSVMSTAGQDIAAMIPTEKILSRLSQFVDFITRLGISISNFLAPYIDKAARGMTVFAFGLTQMFRQIANAGTIQAVFSAMVSFFKFLASFIPQLLGFESFGDILDTIKGKLTSFADTFRDFVESITGGGKAKIKDFGKNIQSGFANIGDSKVVKKLSNFGDVVKKLGDMLKSFGGKIGEKLKDFYEAFKAGDMDKVISCLSLLAIAASYIASIAKLRNTFKKAEDTFSIFKGIGDAFSGIGNAFSGLGKAAKRMTYLIGFTVSLLIFAAAMSILSKMDTGGLIQGGIAAIGALLALAVTMKILDKIAVDEKGAKKVLTMAGAVAAVGAAVLMVTTSMEKIAKIFDSHSPKEFLAIIGTLAGMMIAFGLLAYEFGKLDKMDASLKSAGASMLAIATAIKIMTKAIAAIGSEDPGVLLKGGAIVAGLIVLMGVLAYFTGKSSAFGDVGSGFLKVAAALIILKYALDLYAGMDPGSLALGLLKLGVTLVVLLAIFKKFGDITSPKVGGGLVLAALAVVAFAGALAVLSVIPFMALIKGIAGLVVVLVAIGITMSVLSGLGLGMAVVAASFALLGIAFLAVGGGAMLLASALATLVPLLLMLSYVDTDRLSAGLDVIKMIAEGLGSAFLSLAGGVLAFGAALLVAAIATVVLAAGVILLGAGFAVCGVGLLALAGGLATIALVIDAFFGGELIAKIGEAFTNLGSTIMNGLGGLVQKAKDFFSKDKGKEITKDFLDGGKEEVEGKSGKGFSDAMEDTAGEAVDAFGDKKKEFKDTIAALMMNGGESVDSNSSEITDPLNDLGVDMESITSGNLTDVTNMFGQLPGDAGSAVSANSGALTDKLSQLFGSDMIPTQEIEKSSKEAGEKQTKAYAEAVNKNKKQVSTASQNMNSDAKKPFLTSYSDFKGYGNDAATGYKAGINQYAAAAAREAAKMVRDAKNAAKAEQDSNSPSKEFAKFGRWADEGYILGIRSLSRQVANAAADMVGGGIDAVTDAMSVIADATALDMDFTPTITPVVDLTKVSEGAAGINDILGGSVPLNTPISGFMNAAMAAASFGRNSKDDVAVAVNKLANKLDGMTESMNSRSLNNYITVDGAADPEAFADDLLRSFRLNARTV